jgi:hypothetical protein
MRMHLNMQLKVVDQGYFSRMYLQWVIRFLVKSCTVTLLKAGPKFEPGW